MNQQSTASFRDSCGYIFEHGGEIYRCIEPIYHARYRQIMASGLYETLINRSLLIQHIEIAPGSMPFAPMEKITLKPQKLNLITYPFEWCFCQLKSAALQLLEIQAIAMEFGMTLRDATPFNHQFKGSRVIFIDTLSFDEYQEGTPWIPYRQFCENFLAPLVVAKFRDPSFLKFASLSLQGIPLDIAVKLLPFEGYLNFGILVHLVGHAKLANAKGGEGTSKHRVLSRTGLVALIDSLRRSVESLSMPSNRRSTWSEYRSESNYNSDDILEKESVVQTFIRTLSPKTVLDIGCNDGRFSRIAVKCGVASVVAIDSDHLVIDRLVRSLIQ